METFLGKSEYCMMTAISRTLDKLVFDWNTVLLKISEENDKHRYLYIGGHMICSFLTNDKFYKYVSNMGNNLAPYSIAIVWENIYFPTPHFEFIKKENIDEDDVDNLFDYHVISNCKKLRVNKLHSNYD